MEDKVKCKICGKVGLAKDSKGLRRHLRLMHNTGKSSKVNLELYYELVAPESKVEILSESVKEYRKEKIENGLSGTGLVSIKISTPSHLILYTPHWETNDNKVTTR